MRSGLTHEGVIRASHVQIAYNQLPALEVAHNRKITVYQLHGSVSRCPSL